LADAEETKGESAEAAQPAGEQPSGEPPTGGEQPNEDEIRAQLEEEIRKVRVEDVILQSAVSILNLSARRIAKDDERDLEQAKAGIDAARVLTDLVPEEARGQLRQAVSELQMLYTKHAGGGGDEDDQGGTKSAEGGQPPGDSGLWTPGGSS
jgi:hypothetical protein